MADSLSFLAEDLTCVICCDVFTNPVTLKCSHSFCEKCLQEFWTTQDMTQCPICRKECSQDEPTKSLAFKALCEAFKIRKPTASSGEICQEHHEKLRLFCFEDKKPICVVCYTSKRHENHKCSPVEEAVVNVKENLEEHTDRLQMSIAELQKVQEICKKQVKLIEEHVSIAENQIKQEFEKLHQFLKKEEEKRIRTLRKEVEPQEVRIKARIEELSKQISDLSEKVAAVRQDMKAENIIFLQNYTENLQRLQCPSVPNMSPELEQFRPHSTQTMIFTTWARMQKLVENSPVTLDPNTASNRLLVSQNYCGVRCVRNKLNVSESPERLYVGVLASQGFSSGLHCWDVEVGDNNNWTLGVIGETVNRKVLLQMDPKSHFWCFRYVDGAYRKCSKLVKDISHNERPYVIRVQLDFDRGELRFIDPFRSRSLCTFTGGFPEKLFPYFCTGDVDRPLNLYPGKETLLTHK